jgi:hypothetical protein
MASAPKPGSAGTTEGNEKVEALEKRTTLRLKTSSGEVIERSIRLDAVNFRERAAVRKATGLAFEEFMGDGDGVHIGLDTVQVWWWLAKRAENPMCTLDQALDEWPPMDEIDENTFDVIQDDGQDDDDPEA